MIACTEFYSNSCKILAKFPLCITNLLRLIQTSLLLSLASWLRVFVQPRKNTNKQTDVSVQHTGKWIERITQSERALPWGYFIINTIASILRGDTYTITSIWRENMLGHLSGDIICSEKRTAFRDRSSRKTVSFEEQINVRGQISENIFKVKCRLLCLLFFKYSSQHPGSAILSYTNHIKGCQLASKIPTSLIHFQYWDLWTCLASVEGVCF